MGDGSCKSNVACFFSIVLALGAIGLGVYTRLTLNVDYDECKDNLNKVDSTEDSLKLLQERLENFTSKAKNDSEITSHTITMALALLRNETTQLKRDYKELLSETNALNKTINYTTSSTVKRALDELKSVKETQREIQKKLEALSHLNDTAEDYLNLRKEVEILSTEVNKNITRMEKNLNNREEQQKHLGNETSEIRSYIAALEERLRKIENTSSKSSVSEAGELGLTKAVHFLLYSIVLFATLHGLN